MDLIERYNTDWCLMRYFSTPTKPCHVPEFKEFWMSLTRSEKMYYIYEADLLRKI